MDAELQPIIEYIRASRALHLDDKDIASRLLAASWQVAAVQRAFAQFEKGRPIITLRNIEKTYPQPDGTASVALAGILEFNVFEGEFLAITGLPGSGKNTLLNILGLLDLPTKGYVHIKEKNALELIGRDKERFQRNTFAYVPHTLFGHLTLLEHLLLQSQLANAPRAQAQKKALELLEFLELRKETYQRPREISEQGRCKLGVGMALMKNTPILLAYEPTARVDAQGADQLLSLLRSAGSKYAKTIVFATQADSFAQRADRVVHLEQGRLFKIESGAQTQRIDWISLEEEVRRNFAAR